MGVACVGLVLCDACKCKIKGFSVVSSYERKVQRGSHKGCDIKGL